MPILRILGALVYFGCIFHAIKTGRITCWLTVLVLHLDPRPRFAMAFS